MNFANVQIRHNQEPTCTVQPTMKLIPNLYVNMPLVIHIC